MFVIVVGREEMNNCCVELSSVKKKKAVFDLVLKCEFFCNVRLLVK